MTTKFNAKASGADCIEVSTLYVGGGFGVTPVLR